MKSQIALPSRQDWIFYFFAGLVAFLLIRYQIRLLDFFQWEDESETIVTAKMMAAGYKLYSGVFNNHGPLVFLPGMVLEWFGSFGIKHHRIFTAGLWWVALGSIFFSPLLKNTDRYLKLTYIAVIGTIAFIWLPLMCFSHTYTYQVITGLLLAIVLAQYGLPSIYGQTTSRQAVILGNALLACFPFLAINFAPPAAILFFAFFRRENLKEILVGLCIGVIGNLVFIALFSSFAGWYVIHYYLSVEIMTPLRGQHPSLGFFALNIYKALTEELPPFLGFVVMLIALARLSLGEKGLPIRTLILFFGLLSLLIRGGGIHAPPFYFACLTLPILFFVNVQPSNKKYYFFLIIIAMLCATRLLLVFEWDKAQLEKHRISGTSPFAELVKKLTNKEDRILAYTYRNAQYIYADRLPASGNHHYFYWQELYNRNPILGININTCKDIADNPPKIIYTDRWSDGPIPWANYAQCIQVILDEQYSQVKGDSTWIRNDIFPDYLEKESPK
jgi:hypothetical protein